MLASRVLVEALCIAPVLPPERLSVIILEASKNAKKELSVVLSAAPTFLGRILVSGRSRVVPGTKVA